MHTKISPDNPHGYDRYGFAWECLPAGIVAHLDFGCHDGTFLSTLKNRASARLVGVDVSEEAVKKGHERFPELEIIRICQVADLPFDDGTFNSITVLDVLEHVYEQTEVLAELNRVLKNGGRLIVTVPGQHVFSFLDRGNFKFVFPKLHRWHYCRFMGHSQEEYEHRYVSNPSGLIGDISAKKRWHEHFSRNKLSKLMTEAGFSIIDFDGTSFFSRPIGFINYLFLRRLRLLQPLIARIDARDRKSFESTNLFCVAEKH